MAAADLLQFVLSGLSVGGIYALVAVGFVTIHAVTGVINFAQGELAMSGALAAAVLAAAGLPLPFAVAAAVVVGAAVGLVVDRATVWPALRRRRMGAVADVVLILLTIGASIALRGLALAIFGSEPYALGPFTPGAPIVLAGAVVPRQTLWVLGLSAATMAALALFFGRTQVGAALRACAMNRDAAKLAGISPARMSALAFGLAGAVAGLAGAAIAPISFATYDMGLMLGLKGFVSAVVGGLASPPGAVVGALALGVLESLAAGLVSSGYKDAIAFLVLIAVLLVRPEGFFPGGRLRRV
ncbi:MAG TPA: branched-chain amino acid ABC transporter permease [Thermodesulfobacteriota bacterium]